MRTFSTLLVTGCLLLTTACGRSDRDAPSIAARSGPPQVYVVNYPLKYFTERIAGDQVQVVYPVPGEVDPAFWVPSADQIAACQQADLILRNGAAYAKWMERATLPESKLVNTSAAFADRYIRVQDAVTHSHGPEGEHAHAGTAFTTWLDPQLASLQAAAIHDALARLVPSRQAEFEQNLQALQQDLSDLDAAWKARFGDKAGTPVVFSHPVYQYLERRYELNGRSVHWEPDAPPSDNQWNELDELLKTHPARWMIWEGEPLAETVEKLRQRGVGSVTLDPCGNTPESGDWLQVMRRNVENLAPVYE